MRNQSSTQSVMKKLGWVVACFSLLVMFSNTADAYRHYRGKRFTPRFAASLSGGLTVYNNEYVDQFGVYEDAAFSHGIVGVSGHFWIHPSLSIDLGLDYHFLTDYQSGNGVAFTSIKPGVRVKFGIFYLRGALDMAFGEGKKAMLFGFLAGAGVRVPIARRVRVFGELDMHVLFGTGYVLPLNFKSGLEVVF